MADGRYHGNLINQQPVRSNAPQLFSSLSQRLSAFSNEAENELDVEVAKKAKQKGLIDAQGKTAITLRDGSTIADEAWNEGAVASNLAAIKLDMTENLTRIFEENKDNPKAIKTLSGAYGKGMMKGVPPEIQPLVKDQLATGILNATLKGEANQRTNQRNEQIATTNTAIDTATSELLDALDNGDIEAATDAEIAVKGMIDAMAAGDPTLADDAIKMKAALDKKINRQMVIGEFKKAMDSGKDEEFIKKFQDKKLNKKFDPNDREKLVSEMLTMQKKRDIVLGIKKENFKAELKKVIQARSLGFDVSTADMEQARKNAKAADMLPEFEKAIADIDTVNQYAKSDVTTRRNKIEELNQAGNVDDAPLWQSLRKSDAAIRKAAEDDGYSLGVKQGVIEQTPLDMTKPETFAARKEQAQFLSKHYGVKVSPFTDQETTQFTESLPQMTPDEQVLAATAMSEFNDPKLFQSIAKKGAPVFAVGAAIRDPQIAKVIFQGQSELRLGNAIKLKKTDYFEDLNDSLGGVYSGENLQANTQAVLAYVAAKDSSGEYDSDLMKEAVTAVTGGIGSINGGMVELPRGVDESRMERFAESFTADTIKALGGVDNRSDEDAARMVRDSMWRSRQNGDGGYIVNGRFGALYQNGELLVIQYDPSLPKAKPKGRRGGR